MCTSASTGFREGPASWVAVGIFAVDAVVVVVDVVVFSTTSSAGRPTKRKAEDLRGLSSLTPQTGVAGRRFVEVPGPPFVV